MRGADTAGGEHLIEPGAHLVDRGDDRLRHVRDDAHFAQRDAQLAEAPGQVIDVGILRAAGEHFVADDDDAGGGVHRGRVAVARGARKVFFFEKKNQKTFTHWRAPRRQHTP